MHVVERRRGAAHGRTAGRAAEFRQIQIERLVFVVVRHGQRLVVVQLLLLLSVLVGQDRQVVHGRLFGDEREEGAVGHAVMRQRVQLLPVALHFGRRVLVVQHQTARRARPPFQVEILLARTLRVRRRPVNRVQRLVFHLSIRKISNKKLIFIFNR